LLIFCKSKSELLFNSLLVTGIFSFSIFCNSVTNDYTFWFYNRYYEIAVDLLDEIEMFDAVVQEFFNSNCTS
jgi:hypothetical protein